MRRQIVIRLSIIDRTDPTKKRPLEISVDAPFRILSDQVTENINTLPIYSPPKTIQCMSQHEYNCSQAPEALCVTRPPTDGTFNEPRRPKKELITTSLNSGPANLHCCEQVHHSRPAKSHVQPPTYLFRALPFNPPAFEDEGPPLSPEPPPPLYRLLSH